MTYDEKKQAALALLVASAASFIVSWFAICVYEPDLNFNGTKFFTGMTMFFFACFLFINPKTPKP